MKKTSYLLLALTATFITNGQINRPMYSFAYDYDVFTDKTIEFSPNCKYIAYGTSDGTIKLNNLSNGQEEITYKAHEGMAISVKFNENGNLLASGGRDGYIKIYDIFEKKEIMTIKAHKKSVMCLAFSSDGKKLYSGSRDNTVKAWDLSTGAEIFKIEDIKGNVRCIKFNPDGKSLILCTSALMKGVRFFSMADGKEIKTLESANTKRIDISPNAFFLAAASLEKEIYIWDLRTNTTVFTLAGHNKYCEDVAFSNGGKMLASSSDDKTVILWDIDKGVQIQSFIGHTDDVISLSYSKDGTMLASAGWDGTLKIWDLKPFNKEMVPEKPVVAVGVTIAQNEEEIIKKAFDNLTFETGKDIIGKTSYPSLDELAAVLVQKQNYNLVIEGHTDNVGAEDKNLTLSKNRADAVKKYLTSKNVPDSRLFSNGFGANRPIADNSTDEGRKMNRRVEMKIMDAAK